MDSPSRDLIKCYDCSPDSWIRSVKRRHEELESAKQFCIPELDGLELFSNPKVQIENETELLRETVSSQEQSILDLYEELEKERNASSTVADEAMSVMQRLQNEKAEIQMELRQYKLYAGEKIEHDQQQILALEDLVYQSEQTVLTLRSETQAYKHVMMGYGLTEAEANGDKSLLSHDGNYPPADSPHGREYLKTLDLGISQMETNPSFTQLNGDIQRTRGRDVSEKLLVGQRPRRQRHFRRSFTARSSSNLGASKELRPDTFVDSPRYESFSSKKVENVEYNAKYDSEIGDDMSDRVYTIDSVHHSVSHSVVTEHPKLAADTFECNVVSSREQMDLSDPDIAKLYMRLQALEADRESMKQALLSMRTEKAQMVLLKEIAQHLSKEVVPQRRLPLRKASIAGPLTFTPVFKWITSFVSWRRKSRRSKYMFGMSANNIGLQMLLEKVPRSRKWRCLRSTQV